MIRKRVDVSQCFDIHVLRATDSQPLPKEAMKQQLDLKTIASSAHPLWHKSIITFRNLREDVLSDIQNIEKVTAIIKKTRKYYIIIDFISFKFAGSRN